MSKLSISNVQQGMLLGESIYHPETNKLLLKQGTRLVNAYLEKLKELNILEIEIPDPFTVFLDIRENMESLLEGCYGSMLRKISSPYPEGNMSDTVMKAAPVIKKAVKAICTNSDISGLCVDMQVIDFEALVRTGVFASGYSMLIAALMNLPEEQILNIGIASLIHDIGMCEMYQLIRVRDITEGNRLLWEQHPTYGYYSLIEKNFPREIAELIYAHHEKYNSAGFPRGLKGDEFLLEAGLFLCAPIMRKLSATEVSCTMRPLNISMETAVFPMTRMSYRYLPKISPSTHLAPLYSSAPVKSVLLSISVKTAVRVPSSVCSITEYTNRLPSRSW